MKTAQEQDALLFSGKDIIGTVVVNGTTYRGRVIQTPDFVLIDASEALVQAEWINLRDIEEA